MKFEFPAWLIVIAVAIPLLIWAFRRFDRIRAEALKHFAAPHLLEMLTANVSVGLRSVKRWLFALVIVLCLVALARPQAGFRWQEVKRKGIDILFAIDTSKSMLAQDVNPDRLTRAKLAVTDLVEKLQGDRVGLIAFAGSSFLQSPLTLDYDAFRQSLDALDTGIIPKGGTDIATAIREAESAFSLGGQNHKILVILTDGEDLEANGIAAAKQAAKNGMRIFTVGVGSSGGELIPIPGESGGIDFLKDAQGKPVKSKLDDSTLRKIAEAAGGSYEPLGRQGEGLDTLYERTLSQIPKQELSSRMNKIYTERFQWPLALAVLLLVIESMLGDRRSARKLKFEISKLKWARAAGAFVLLALAAPAWASPQSAEKAYQSGKFPEAVSDYKAAAEKNPGKPELVFNTGAAAYKSGAFAEAAAAFQKSMKTDQVELQQQAFYNLGNTQYRIGQQTEKTKPEQTIQAWQQALGSYESAMGLRKDDADAKFNYEFVKKKLEELQKQQEQEKKQDQKDQKDQKDQQKNEQKDQQKDQQKNDQKDQQNDQQKKDEKKDQQEKDQQKDQKKDQGQKDENKPQDGSDQKQDPQNNEAQQDKPQDPKDSQQQNAGAGDEQKKEEQKRKQEQAKQEQGKDPKEEKKPSAGGQPEEKKGEKPSEEREPQPLPGQMSKEEAKNLLDSLKGDEKKMPAAAAEKTGGFGWEDTPKRDW